MDRVIGILGGMGPEATVDLYRHIIDLTPANRDQEHIRALIYSNPKIPDRTLAILGGGEDPLPHLIRAAKLLEDAGAEVLAIPCNAAHYFLPRLRQQLRVPVLDMIGETFSFFRARFPESRAVGLLGASGTVRSGVYENSFRPAGVAVLVPDERNQQRVQDGISSIKAGTHDSNTRDMFQSIGCGLVKAGAQAVILGCTEIPLAFDSSAVDYPTLNPTRILAQAAVDWALGRRD